MEMRLQKILSAAGVASRRAAERLIAEGHVSVNGTVVREMGTKADPEADDIRVDGRRVHRVSILRYLLLNKPRGVVTTRRDPEGRPTVIDLLHGVHEYVYPVGRLDYDSEGLLLLTNDGELATRLTHPRHGVERAYEARVRGLPTAASLDRLARGITIEGRRTLPAAVRLLETGRGREGDQVLLSITLREGRGRQVRKMCEAIGHPVVRLRRVRIGPIADPGLRPGEFRDLTRSEVRRLQEAASRLAPARPEAEDQAPEAGGERERAVRPERRAARPSRPQGDTRDPRRGKSGPGRARQGPPRGPRGGGRTR